MTSQSQEIIDTASAMLEERLSWIVGAWKIRGLAFQVNMEWDDDILPFTWVDSETDALPIDSRVRELWSPKALAALQPKIDAKEAWAREFLTPYCHRLIARLGSSATEEGNE